jgi:hypothetical protein
MEYRPIARVAGMAVVAAILAAGAYAAVTNVAETNALPEAAASPVESVPPLAAQPAASAGTVEATVTVFKDPNCGCCKEWVTHLRKHAFTVVARDTSDVAGIKATARVPRQLHSCHTAFVDGYVVEGHVPAADIQRLLAEKPKVAGIAVAGMPAGSPGMEVGGRVDRYDVIAFGRDGRTSVFARH